MRRGAAYLAVASAAPSYALGAPLDTSLDSLDGETHARFLQLVELTRDAGLDFKVRSTARSCAQQNALFAIGRNGDTRAQVTKAQGCVSWHVHGKAIDVTMTKGTYDQFGALAKSQGWKWGGDFPGFPDVGHIEWHPGVSISQACPNPAQCNIVIDTAMPELPPAPDRADQPADASSTVTLLLGAAVVVVVAVAWART